MVTCPIDSLYPVSYRLSIGTIPLSASFPRYLAPKLRHKLLRDDVINGRHLGFCTIGNRSIRSAVPENPTLGSNTKSIRRSVPEIRPFETLNLMTSLMTSQGPDPQSVRITYFPHVGDHRVKISAWLAAHHCVMNVWHCLKHHCCCNWLPPLTALAQSSAAVRFCSYPWSVRSTFCATQEFVPRRNRRRFQDD